MAPSPARSAPKIRKIPKSGTKRLHLLSCGVGSFYNDLVNKIMYSFGLVYFMRVAGLSSSQAGLVMVSGSIANFLGNAVFGFCCDKVDIPWLSARIGRRKSWHLFGTAFTAITFVFAFSRCFICTEASPAWFGFLYFTMQYASSCFFYGAVECAHISLVPQVAVNENDAVMISAFRTGFCYVGGIMAYLIAWVVLGRTSESNLSSSHWKEFTIITCICTAVGLVFVSGFQIGTRERTKAESNKRDTPYFRSLFRSAGTYSVALAFRQERPAEYQPGTYKYIQGAREDIGDNNNNNSNNNSTSVGKVNTGYEDNEENEWSTAHSKSPEERANSLGPGKRPQARTKPLKEWLKDARLYKICFVLSSVVGMENTINAFLALYLTDYLHFEKEATAYCSLIFLCSGIVGSAVSKRLSRTIGRNWTTCVFAGSCVAAAVWFYFVTPAVKQMVYAPLVLIGSGVSGLMVMVFSFVTDVLSSEKESAGLLFSIGACTQKGLGAITMLLIQGFYPDSSSSDCAGCAGRYIHWMYPLVVGTMSLAILLFFVRHCERCPCLTQVRSRVESIRLADLALGPRSRYYTV